MISFTSYLEFCPSVDSNGIALTWRVKLIFLNAHIKNGLIKDNKCETVTTIANLSEGVEPLNAVIDKRYRLYALESSKDVTVSSKIGDTSLVCSFRRIPRGGIEQNQFDSLVELVRSVTIVPSADRWISCLELACVNLVVSRVNDHLHV
ncbi:hypothetical protein Tco_0858672 [Tanacetum coccineum]|uniref:Uncharacterized protein n=1 Tax=Tanacetum coccineum TaxID=301880 RepID=A0ABQ5B9X6_9ASTR